MSKHDLPALFRIKPVVDPPIDDEVTQLVKELKNKSISGIRNLLVKKVHFGDRHANIVFLGEVHTNPDLCPMNKESTDVVLDLVLDYLLRLQPTVLILETFYHLESVNQKSMEKILEHMGSRMPLEIVKECLLNKTDKRCVYREGSSALMFLRMFTSIVRYMAILYPDHDAIRNLSKRILAMDPREDLGMIAAFAEILGRDITKAEITQSLEKLTPENLAKFLPEIEPLEWKHAFQDVFVDPFFDLVRRTRKTKSRDMYTEIFLRVPDVIAFAHILSVLGHCLVNTMVVPIIIVYVGDTHRRALSEMLDQFHIFERTENLVDRFDVTGGSCVSAA